MAAPHQRDDATPSSLLTFHLFGCEQVMPMIFAPESLGPGLTSPLADMKNTGDANQGQALR